MENYFNSKQVLIEVIKFEWWREEKLFSFFWIPDKFSSSIFNHQQHNVVLGTKKCDSG